MATALGGFVLSNRYQIEPLERRQMLSIVPAVVSAQFEYLTAQRLVIQFNTDVSASLSNADLQLQNHTTMSRTATASLSLLSYQGATNTAVFAIPGAPNGVLPDGNYRLRVLKAGVTDAMGTPMTQDGVLDFFVLSADANRDRAINVGDFSSLAANFNAPNNFAGGDFNYSGVTDISDFAILASKFNQTLPALSAPTTRYSVTILPASASAFGSFVTPYALNDSGQIVGEHYILTGPPPQGNPTAFSWRPGDATLGLGASSTSSRAFDVSNSGLIVGHNTFSSRAYQTLHGGVNEAVLGHLNSSVPENTYPFAINSSNVIVGSDRIPDMSFPRVPRGVRWPTGPGSIQSIGGTILTGINDNADMIGDGPKLYQNGGLVTTIGTSNGLAMGVNQSREVVGVIGSFDIARPEMSTAYQTNGRPFYWKPGMADTFILESNSNESEYQARAINNQGTVVGSFQQDRFPIKGIIWRQGIPYDLQTLIDPPAGTNVFIFGAADINNNGQIVAYGDIDPDPMPSVGLRAFLLTPIPATEPLGSQPQQNSEISRAPRSGAPSPQPTQSTSRAPFGAVRIDVLEVVE